MRSYIIIGEKKLNQIMGVVDLNDGGKKLFGTVLGFDCVKLNIPVMVDEFDKSDYILVAVFTKEKQMFRNYSYKILSNGKKAELIDTIIDTIQGKIGEEYV